MGQFNHVYSYHVVCRDKCDHGTKIVGLQTELSIYL